MWPYLAMIAIVFGGFCLAVAVLRKRFLATLSDDADEDPNDPAVVRRRREDMIFIWTEINGVPRQRAEAMYEEYERATAVASLGLKSK